MHRLNQALLDSQKVSPEQAKTLEELYTQLDALFETCAPTTDDILEVVGEEVTNMIKEIEFQLQVNWNFEKDELKHTWWNKVPGCKCPRIDNDERFGCPKLISSGCPIHKHMMPTRYKMTKNTFKEIFEMNRKKKLKKII